MPKWPKPAEGSWTAALSGARHRADLVRGLDLARVLRARARGDLQAHRGSTSAGSSSSRGRAATSPRSSPSPTRPSSIVRDIDGEVRAFHNICRHRGNKLVWTDFPREESSGQRRQFVCKYHGWKYDLDGACSFVQQEGEFFDFDKADYGLVPVHCDVWAGFIFVNLDRRAAPDAARLPRADDHRDRRATRSTR